MIKVIKFLKYLNPQYIWFHSRGICPVCSKKTVFICTDKLELIRNHAVCVRCKSVSRHRAIALCVLKEFAKNGVNKLSDFKTESDLIVLNTSNSSPIAKALGKGPNIYSTEYFEDCKSGQTKNGIMCQDLENLSFDSNSLNLIITEDVFEHVKDIEKGFSEVYRVLKKNGIHVFSIPFYFGKRTRDLFEMKGNKYLPVVLPIEYHDDGIRGMIPAYHNLGYDMFDMLEKIGFETKIHFSQFHEYKKYATYNSYTFISKKI